MDDTSLNDNPYEEMVDECIKRQSYQIAKQSSPKTLVRAHNGYLPAESHLPLSQAAALPDEDRGQINSSGVKITVNDSIDAVADLEPRYNSKWVR